MYTVEFRNLVRVAEKKGCIGVGGGAVHRRGAGATVKASEQCQERPFSVPKARQTESLSEIGKHSS